MSEPRPQPLEAPARPALSFPAIPSTEAVPAPTARLTTPAWEKGLYLLFVWIAIEDQLRKAFNDWLAIYFIKDVIAGAILVGCLRSSRRAVPLPVFPRTLASLVFWGLALHVLGAANPRLWDPVAAVIGIKLTFSYVVLFIVGARLAQEGRTLRGLFQTILATGTVTACFGIYQALFDPYFLTPEREGSLEDALLWLTREDDLRYATSTFLSPGRYVFFLLNTLAVGLVLCLWRSDLPSRAVYIGALAIVVAGILTSAARSGITSVVALVAGMCLLAYSPRFWGQTHSHRSRRRTGVAGVILGLVLLLAPVLASSEKVRSLMNFYWVSLVTEGSEELWSRVEAYSAVDPATWLVGNGTGSASYGVFQVLQGPRAISEGGFASIIWELGVLGLLFYLALAFQLCRIYLQWPRKPSSSLLRALVIAFGPLTVWELLGMNALGAVLQQYVAAIFLWFFAGLTYGLRTLESGRPGGPD